MKKIKIKFSGLKVGRYDYEFKIDDHFFDNYEESEIRKGNVDIKTEMVVSKDLLKLNFKLSGEVDVQCDRCLEYFSQAIKFKAELFVEFGDNNSDLSDADNKIVLSHRENEIILDKHLYDYIHLSLPYQKIHPEDENGNSTCETSMIEKLDHINSNNNHDIDPRWDKLKDIYN